MKTGIIIQARLGSTRLPNKMVLPFDGDKGILEVLLERLKKAIDTEKYPIILATTINPLDDRLVSIAARVGIPLERGSENDVLDRFITAASKHNITNIIRVCADNPFLDVEALKELISISNSQTHDYYSFKTKNDVPTILTSYGFWAEAVSLAALKEVAQSTEEKLYREHVTNYIYKNSNQFSICLNEIKSEIEKHKDIRLTVDTEQDFKLVKEIFHLIRERNIAFNATSIVNFIAAHPAWLDIMKSEILANKK